jgi:hypothetical protein
MRLLPPIGELTQNPDVPEWWTSRPVPVPYFSGQPVPFTIMVGATGSDDPTDVAEAIRNFLSLDTQDRLAASERVFQNYRDFVEAVEEVDVEIEGPSEVWGHVRPTGIYVDRRNRRDKDVYVQVACDCDWEVEHGLQLVFRRDSKLIRVSEQDGHLTHADAYDLPEDQDDA